MSWACSLKDFSALSTAALSAAGPAEIGTYSSVASKADQASFLG